MPRGTDPVDRPIVGIVLAAGLARRLGRPKQLLDLGGKPLIAHIVERCLASSLDTVIVVTGHAAGAVGDAVADYAAHIVHNPDYANGQASSLLAGLAAAGENADAVVVLLGDQPGISPVVIDRVIAARRAGARLAMVQYGVERGHPVLFGRELFDELRTISGDQGGRAVIRHHPDDLVLVPGDADHVPIDIDTEEAYLALLEGGLPPG